MLQRARIVVKRLPTGEVALEIGQKRYTFEAGQAVALGAAFLRAAGRDVEFSGPALPEVEKKSVIMM